MKKLISIFALMMIVACAPAGSGGGGSSTTLQTSPQKTSSAPTSTNTAPSMPTSNGTYSLGGGNGIDGRATETYRKSIDTFPEYKHFVLPLLRRMAQGKPDVLLAYLTWSIHQKPWYFVPVELPKLPKEQIHSLFETDQLALHAMEGIFIYAPKYNENTEKERAVLLIHEMVMAARLLMKESPAKQCAALSKGADLAACKNPLMMKAAIAPPLLDESGKTPILGGVDHEKVRMMTVFLTSENQDVTGINVFAERTRLGFDFPWDSTISYLTLSDLVTILKRSQLAGDDFVRVDLQGAKVATVDDPKTQQLCTLVTRAYESSFGTENSLSASTELTAKDMVQHSWLTDSNNMYMHGFNAGNFWFNSQSNSDSSVESKGILDTTISDKVVNVIRVLPTGFPKTKEAAEFLEKAEESIFDFYVTQDENPRMIEFRSTKVHALTKESSSGKAFSWQNIEYVPIRNQPVIRCVLRP